jgi:hypothetical protein
MCEICDWNQKLQPAQKDEVAVQPNGTRTIWGAYAPQDAAVLAKSYPQVGEQLIGEIASLIRFPRVLEVAGIVEMVERYLEGSFSTIRDAGVRLAANPLSLFYWAKGQQTVRRVKTFETELMHGPMEKLALRAGSLRKINELLNQRHGMQVTFGCSCCTISVATADLDALYASPYYQMREGFGRLLDSDVLSVSDQLFTGVSVNDIPAGILALTADFHEAEVASYDRFAKAVQAAVAENPVHHEMAEHLPAVREFLVGSSLTYIAAE